MYCGEKLETALARKAVFDDGQTHLGAKKVIILQPAIDVGIFRVELLLLFDRVKDSK
jgi:hypothetical protein